MAISPSYCTLRDIEDVYPNINDYDSKEAIYGWDNTDTSNQYQSNNTGLITQLYFDGVKGTSVSDSPNADFEYNYSLTTDSVQVFHSTKNPNDMLMESGEDFSTLMTRIIKNASRYFDARVDSRLPRDQFKDKEGNYDYIIVRTVALIAACFQIKSQDPNSEALAVLEEEYNMNLAMINNGQVAMSNQVTSDSSKGILREVLEPQNANPLRIVDTRGNYHGVYDNFKIIITGTGGIGTGTFDVFGRDDDSLKIDRILKDEKINGSYQHIGYGLQIRFAGKDDNSVATENDEYELEVWGKNEELDNPIIKSVKMTRGGSIY